MTANSAIGMGPQDRSERDRFENELHRLIDSSHHSGITLRVLGSLAFQLHCPQYGHLQEAMGRAYTDIDFAGYRREAEAVRSFMTDLGYTELRHIFIQSDGYRAIFENADVDMHVDIFYEHLDFSHVIPWDDGRLYVDSPTIPLAEMLLEKMQIVKINEKDIIDTIMLLLEHPVGETDEEAINMVRVGELIREDWGLWKTTTINLEKVKRLSQDYDQLTAEHKQHVVNQVDKIVAWMESEPKPLSWRLRDRVGERLKWYTDVEDL